MNGDEQNICIDNFDITSMRVRYAIEEILMHGTDREWIRKRCLSRIVSRYFKMNPPEGRSRVIDHDWDTLVLLDACRYDLFYQALTDFSLPGDLSKRKSMASGTPGYLAKNFRNETFHDIVYVTANPYIDTELPENTFHRVVSVWRDGWDSDLGTVLPETVAEAAYEAREKFPNKRIIVHFNQPHTPFIGKKRISGRGMRNLRSRAMGGENGVNTMTPFEQLDAGELDKKTVWEAYRSNLNRVLPVVKEVLISFQGLTVVTSDHGNALGERAWPFPIRVYGHPLGILIPPLINVPCHIHNNGKRPNIESEPPDEFETSSVQCNVSERLSQLGYID
jgi:hypothetical protein